MATNTYAYKVRDTTGRFREGKVRAGSENAVAEKLLGMGYVPLEVRRTGTGLQKEINLGRKKVTTKDLAIAARQLATMVDAGLSLLRALTILGEQVENPELRRVLVRRRDRFAGLRDLLVDPERAGFWLVATAERLPVAETQALHTQLRALGIPVRRLVVNRRSPADGAVLTARRAVEDQHLAVLADAVPGVPLTEVPLLPGDLTGEPALAALAEHLT